MICLDVGEGHRADVVLQVLELLDVRLGKEIGARRQHLAELHVRGPELDEPLAERDGALDGAVAVRRIGAAASSGESSIESLLPGEVAQAVAGEQPDGRRQPRQEARSQDHAAVAKARY